jgi:hypothetical protein
MNDMISDRLHGCKPPLSFPLLLSIISEDGKKGGEGARKRGGRERKREEGGVEAL